MIIPDPLLDALRGCSRPVVMTGAGISAESGIPTFRDAGTGLWARFRPEDLATPQAFDADPELVWNWYQWRREQLSEVSPNAGHRALVELGRHKPLLTLVTQNVDGLHQAAGSKQVIELHGSIVKTICHKTGKPVDERFVRQSGEVPPRSPHHPDGLCRPAVVWFGEALPAGALNQAMDAARRCDLFLSVGTSSVVEPAASLALMAGDAGACVVEINPAETPLTQLADFALKGPAGSVLPKLVEALKHGSDPNR